jgi:hypothetical protein
MIIIFILFIIMLLFVLYISNFKVTNSFNDTFTNINEKGTNDNGTNDNIVLIGDSILNNSAYVSQDKSVPDLLSKKMNGSTIYNFAKDGSTLNDCYTQLDKISLELNNSNTTIFLSCGGNNILNNLGTRDVKSITNLFRQYSELIVSIKTRVPNASLYVLNLYYPTNGHYKSYYKTIEQWNTLLQDNASDLDYTLINLSSLLVLDEDFVYNIEPSFKGGQKIVDAISNTVIN